MPITRLPKICYNRLYELDQQNKTNSCYNWVSQVREIIEAVDDGQLWSQCGSLDSREIGKRCKIIVIIWEKKLKDNIIERGNNSKYGNIYKNADSQEFKTEWYLKSNISLNKTRIISQ